MPCPDSREDAPKLLMTERGDAASMEWVRAGAPTQHQIGIVWRGMRRSVEGVSHALAVRPPEAAGPSCGG